MVSVSNLFTQNKGNIQLYYTHLQHMKYLLSNLNFKSWNSLTNFHTAQCHNVTTVALDSLESSLQLAQQTILAITKRNNYYMPEITHVPKRPCYLDNLNPRLVIGKLIFGNLPRKKCAVSLSSEPNVSQMGKIKIIFPIGPKNLLVKRTRKGNNKCNFVQTSESHFSHTTSQPYSCPTCTSQDADEFAIQCDGGTQL